MGHHVPLQKMVRVLRIGQLKKILLLPIFSSGRFKSHFRRPHLSADLAGYEGNSGGMLPSHEDLLLPPVLHGNMS